MDVISLKKTELSPFSEYVMGLNEKDKNLIDSFFVEFDIHCLLSKSHKTLMKEDFEKAILYYINNGKKLEEALKLLDVSKLGGFYARDTSLWFPIDYGARTYPITLKHGQMSVFRVAMNLKHEVIPELLQIALTFTIKRFPSFATTLKKGIFWHYLDISRRRYYVYEENDIPCLPIKIYGTRSQSFRVMYYKNRISAEFFHAITDGTGGMEFLKSLVSEYLRLAGSMVENDSSVLNIDDTPKTEEFANEFANVKSTKNPSGFIDKRAVQINGKLSVVKPCRVLHFRMDTSKLKEKSKERNCTITVYLLALFMMAFKYASDAIKGDFSVQVPVNLRKYYPSKTLRNFTLYCGVRIPVSKSLEFDYLIKEITKQLEEKASKEQMTNMISSTKNLVTSTKFIPLIIKKPIVQLIYSFLSEPLFTTTFSNLGVIKMPSGYEKYIDSIDFVLGTLSHNRIALSAASYNNVTVLTITKNTIDPSFEERLYQLLEKDGLVVRVEGSEICEN